MVKKKQTPKAPPHRARAADVLGNSPPDAKIRPEWQKYQRRLLEIRDYLQSRPADLAKDAAAEIPAYSMHMADAGTDTFDRDLALSTVSSEQEALCEIEEALSRMREGTYGRCQLTGQPIEPDRLQALPWTRFSADAEKQLEREGGAPKTRLGPRGPVPRTITSLTAPDSEGEEPAEGGQD